MLHIRHLTRLVPQPVRFGLRRLAYAGTAIRCECCGSGVRKFIDHGGTAAVIEARKVVGGMRRVADRCPVCHGCDRTRMMMLYLDAVAGLGSRPMRVLHVAPDLGLYLWLKRKAHVTYVGTDLDGARYNHIEGFRQADLTKLPFAERSFDIAICSHVLEHVPDDRKAMAEMFRVLDKGGRAMLLTPYATDGGPTEEDPTINDPAEQDRRFGQWDHVRIYARPDFEDRMRSVGFRVETFFPFESHPDAARDLRLNPLEVLPVGLRED